MAAFDVLKQYINTYIRQNGVNAITGSILNTTLTEAVDALGTGMRYMGLADTTTTPVSNDYPKFYLTFTPGNYTNFISGGHGAFKYGLAILYDAGGTNNWQIYIFNIKAPVTPENTFLVAAKIIDNEYAGDISLYIPEATRHSSGSSLQVNKINKEGQELGTVATITETGLASGYKEYTTDLTDTSSSKIKLSINWDAIPSTGQTNFGKSMAIPQSAFSELGAPVDLTSIYTRLRTTENAVGINNSAMDGRAPNYESAQTIYSVAGNPLTAYTLDPFSPNTPWSADWSFGRCIAGNLVLKGAAGSLAITIKTQNFSSLKSFSGILVVPNLNNSELTITFSSDNSTLYPIVGIAQTTISPNSAGIFTIIGVRRGAYNITYNDNYEIYISKQLTD